MTTTIAEKPKRLVITCGMSEYMSHCSEMDGVCLACGEWSMGGVEPDASGYPCECCDAERVMGAENAMICGRVRITE